MNKVFGISVLVAAGAVAFSLGDAGHAAGPQTAAPAATAAPALKPATFTSPQAARGATLYATNCVECHGAHLDDGQFGPALKGQAFTQLHQGQGLDVIYDFMSAQMPPTAPGSLPPQAYADVLAYILSQNGVAASAGTELPAENAALNGMATPK